MLGEGNKNKQAHTHTQTKNTQPYNKTQINLSFQVLLSHSQKG